MHPGFRRTALVAACLVIGAALAGCTGDDDSPDPSTTTDSQDALGCGLVDEDLVVAAVGGSVTSDGTGLLPADQADFRVMDCTITTVSSTVPFIKISIDTLDDDQAAARQARWPDSPADLGCHGAWLASGKDAYGAACLDDNAPSGSQDTSLSSLWGNYAITVGIVRDTPRPDDAETAYQISKNVYEHVTAG